MPDLTKPFDLSPEDLQAAMLDPEKMLIVLVSALRSIGEESYAELGAPTTQSALVKHGYDMAVDSAAKFISVIQAAKFIDVALNATSQDGKRIR